MVVRKYGSEYYYSHDDMPHNEIQFSNAMRESLSTTRLYAERFYSSLSIEEKMAVNIVLGGRAQVSRSYFLSQDPTDYAMVGRKRKRIEQGPTTKEEPPHES